MDVSESRAKRYAVPRICGVVLGVAYGFWAVTSGALAVGLACVFVGGLPLILDNSFKRAEAEGDAPAVTEATSRAAAQLRGYVIAAQVILPAGIASIVVAIARQL